MVDQVVDKKEVVQAVGKKELCLAVDKVRVVDIAHILAVEAVHILVVVEVEEEELVDMLAENNALEDHIGFAEDRRDQ